jgi:hypothetical protein
MGKADFGVFMAIFAVSGGFAIAVYALWLDGRKRHLRHIERMAMIEKGITPPSLATSVAEGENWSPGSRRRQRRSGVFMICLGIALGILFYSQRQGLQSVWIGAFIAMIGVANLVNALLDDRDANRHRRPKLEP